MIATTAFKQHCSLTAVVSRASDTNICISFIHEIKFELLGAQELASSMLMV